MKKIGFLDDEIKGVYKLVAGIMHLGNVKLSETFRNGMDTVMLADQKGKYKFSVFSTVT